MATHARTFQSAYDRFYGKRHTKLIFIDFFVDFSDFARTAENPFINPLED